MIYPEVLTNVINSFKKIPGVGEKSAERYAFALSELDEEYYKEYKEFLGDNASDYDFAIVHGNHLDEAKEFGEEVKTELGIDKLDYCNLGVCIGLHAGPTLTGIACIKVRNL